ncbi:MAG: DUF4153 domain-containing protein [Nitrospirota bacterium]|nr:DUF4153 domain-containing protein [Nitrospirota bacterium]
MDASTPASRLRGFAQQALRVPLRFPLPLLCAVAWTAVMTNAGHSLPYELRGQASLYLPAALFASLAAHLLAESRGWRSWAGILAATGGAGLVALFPWGALGGPENVVTARWWLAMPTAFLAAICAPFLRRGVDDRAAWQFVAVSLRHMGLALVVALVAAAGLVALVSGLKVLFDANPEQWVTRLIWFGCLGTGAAWLALAGIPRGFTPPDSRPPRAERWLVTGMLVPLAVVYGVLIHAFAVLSLVRWQLPEGRTGWTIACFAAFGVAAWLAAWPWREGDNRLLRLWGRWFPLALPVPVLLLTTAALERMGAYGVTESRYGLLLLAVWLAGLAAYGNLARPPRLMVAPAALAALLLLACFGPWGAGPVSTRSQLAQLEALLTAHGDLPGEASVGALPVADVRERIRSVAKYLQADPKQDAYQAWLARYGFTEEKTDATTWDMLTEPEPMRLGKWFALHTGDFEDGVEVTGYDTLLPLTRCDSCTSLRTFSTSGGDVTFAVKGTVLKVWRDGLPEQAVEIDLTRLNGGRRKAGMTPVVPGPRMTLEAHNNTLRVRLYVERIEGRLMQDVPVVRSLRGYLLVGSPDGADR